MALILALLAALAQDAASEVIAPPVAVELTTIPWPAGAPEAGSEGSVSQPAHEGSDTVELLAHLWIGADGAVSQVEIVRGAGEPFDNALREGAMAFRFQPARAGGVPIEVVLPFTYTFVRPPPEPVAEAATDVGPRAVLEGLVVERGTRRAVAGAAIVGESTDGRFVTQSDAAGHFRLEVAPGVLEVRVVVSGYRKFRASETLKPDDLVKVKYLVDRESYGTYETVVVGARDRAEISRTTLRGREITHVPGTFGDPFRVVSLLPGVSLMMGLLPFPIVRGSSPGSTGFFLDATRVPLLFHLLGGPAVVHPELIDHVDFHPGGFPVTYGGFTGGIVDGVTRRARSDESRFDLDLNLSQTGIFVRRPIETLGVTATVSGRYGYPGLLLSLAQADASLGYWDYQARVDGGTGVHGWTAFVYGARDLLESIERDGDSEIRQTLALFHFHRGDVRWHRGTDDEGVDARLVFGFDETQFGGDQGMPGSANTAESWLANPRARWHGQLAPALRAQAGAEASARRVRNQTPEDSDLAALNVIAGESGTLWNAGAFAELRWQPRDEVLVVPGVRGDFYSHRGVRQWSVDPRLLGRWRVRESTWLKGVVGRYHQPPRLFIQVPGIEESALEKGLLASTQFGAGAEWEMAQGIELDVQAYFNHMDPVLLDLQISTVDDVQRRPPTSPAWELPPERPQQEPQGLAAFLARRAGRAYGLEVLLRKRDTGDGFFGWIAYTLSRSERREPGEWIPFDFDRTHMVNLVAGVRLPRNWEMGGRLLLQTGTPVSTIHGHNVARTPMQMRADIRFDKRAVWNDWLLDFYVDIVNLAVSPESGGILGSQTIRYLVPTVGFRAVL